MATTKDWTSTADVVADRLLGLAQPSATRYFADGDATAWCKHTAAGIYRAVTVDNLDASADLYVAVGPALSVTRGSTQHAKRIVAGQGYTFVFAGGTDGRTEFSTWGAAGAAHAVGLVFELEP